MDSSKCINLPGQWHMAWRNTFQQLFLYKRLSFQRPQQAAQMQRSGCQETEQQHTLNPLHWSDLVAFSCNFTMCQIYEADKIQHWSLSFCAWVVAYVLVPRSQNSVPNINAMTVVKRNLTAVYGGLRQYDKCCFHKQAWHWVKNGWEYWVGKYSSFVLGAGLLKSWIRALFLLNKCHASVANSR